MQESWDVLVVGAGPAGGLAALDCARRGLTVLLVEKRAFPRWKVCGCCFNKQAQATLASLGQKDLIIDRGGVRLQTLRLGLNGRQTSLAIPDGFALSRERFDQALMDAVVEAGASVRCQMSAGVEEVQPGWRIVRLKDQRSGQQNHVRARVVLVAAGLAQRCLPEQDAGITRIRSRSRVGAGCVLVDDEKHYTAGAIHMAIGERGYVGLVRREDGLLNLAAAFDRQALAHGQGAAGATQDVLMQAGFPPPAALRQGRWQLTPALSRGAEVVAGERFLVMGDAAGYVEPFTGEGIAWALTAGAAAAPFVEEGLLRWSHDLEKRWTRELKLRIGRRQRICRTLAMVLRQPKPTRALFELSSRWPALSERIVASLNHVTLPSAGSQQCL